MTLCPAPPASGESNGHAWPVASPMGLPCAERIVIALVGLAFEARIAAGPGVFVICRNTQSEISFARCRPEKGLPQHHQFRRRGRASPAFARRRLDRRNRRSSTPSSPVRLTRPGRKDAGNDPGRPACAHCRCSQRGHRHNGQTANARADRGGGCRHGIASCRAAGVDPWAELCGWRPGWSSIPRIDSYRRPRCWPACVPAEARASWR